MTQFSTAPGAHEPYSLDDIVIWPDGVYAELGDVWAGHYSWRSDDYEILRLEDEARLRALGLRELLDDPAA